MNEKHRGLVLRSGGWEATKWGEKCGAFLREGQKCGPRRTNFAVEGCRVDGLAEDLDDELLSSLKGHTLSVIALEDGFSSLLAGSNTEGLPASVVAAGV